MKRTNRFYMLAGISILAVLLIAGLQTPVQAINITYTTDYASPSDAPSFGTMIGPSDYYLGDTRSGGAQTGSNAMPYGNALDQARVYIWDWDYPTPDNPFKMMKWDMGFTTDFVRVYPDCENGFQTDGHDYLEWSLWGSNNPAEDSSAWTLLWDPVTAQGTSVHDLEVTTVNGSATSAKIYRYGTDLDVGIRPGDILSDAFTIDFTLPEDYQYFGIRTSMMAFNSNDPDPEIGAVATIPEPYTLLLLVFGLISVVVIKRRFKKVG